MIIAFEKDPIRRVARDLDLSYESALEVYAVQCAELAKGKDYEVEGRQYRAMNWVDALNQYEEETGSRPPREAVVEIV